MAKRTTKKQFEEFKKWCKYYQKKLNLLDWGLSYWHGDMPEKLAMIEYSLDTRTACAQMCTEYHECWEETMKRPKNLAKHEMCHLLFADLVELSIQGGWSTSKVNNEEEKIVRVLERLKLEEDA